MSLIVSDLWIYPVKSTMGQRVAEATVTARGLRGDRCWMVVDDNGKMISQRECGALQKIHAVFEDGVVKARASGQRDLVLLPGQPRRNVTVWDDVVSARVGEQAAIDWFSTVLERNAYPVFMDEHSQRSVDQDYARPDDVVSFADGFPLLLIGEGSLAELNQRLPTPVDMRRFRPNVVVRGASAFAEDGWRRIRIDGVDFDLVKLCSRCVLTTRDPDSGELDASREPLRTLSTFRRQAGGVMFGQNVIARGAGVIRQNASVTIID